MTDLATLLALAERCEQAAGPDRELDFAIAAGLGWPDGRYSPPILPFERVRPPRHYTDSLDTAAALVPEGWTWARFHGGVVECMTLNGPGGSILFERGQGTSTALALCAAALRARAAMG
jgi:hypothetical protein